MVAELKYQEVAIAGNGTAVLGFGDREVHLGEVVGMQDVCHRAWFGSWADGLRKYYNGMKGNGRLETED